MVDTPRSPPGFCRGDSGNPSRVHEEYHPEALTSQQREELHRRNVEALHTPIVGETAEDRALEATCLATLAVII